MNTSFIILSIAGAIAIGAISPGPSFLVVARTSLASTRANGLAVALGMGIGAIIFSAATILGLQILLTAVPWLYTALKIGGGAYLIYLGYRTWKSAKSPLQLDEEHHAESLPSLARSFFLGLGTQLSNPKTAVVYGSIFASLLPHEVPLLLTIILPLIVFFIEAGWYSIVAFVLSSASPKDTYLRYKNWIDRIAGSIMGMLGVRLLTASSKI